MDNLRALAPGNGEWELVDILTGDDELLATVGTSTGPATCSAEETSVLSGVEITDNCGNREITAGGSSECTITNAVFFEGIPMLSELGMALMALLMLGVGFIGIRRFARSITQVKSGNCRHQKPHRPPRGFCLRTLRALRRPMCS